MSTYTYIYPTEGFDLNQLPSDIEEAIKDDEKILNSLWERITGICVANPALYKKEDPIEYIMDMTKKYFDKYIEVSRSQNHKYFTKTLIETIEENAKYPSEDPDYVFRPHLWYNHFEFANNPETGIRETKDNIETIKKRIIGYACASPNDILFKADDETGNDAIRYLLSELEDYKVWLDDEVYKHDFCELLVKYWDTHEQD